MYFVNKDDYDLVFVVIEFIIQWKRLIFKRLIILEQQKYYYGGIFIQLLILRIIIDDFENDIVMVF